MSKAVPSPSSSFAAILLVALMLAVAPPAVAQDPPGAERVARLVVEPTSLVLQAGERTELRVRALDAAGAEVTGAMLQFVAPREAIQTAARAGQAPATFTLTGTAPGDHRITVVALGSRGADGEPVSLEVPVVVNWPPVTRLQVSADAERLFAGTVVRHRAAALHADGSERPTPAVRWTSSNPSVAVVDRFGNVEARSTGRVTITASFEGVRQDVSYNVTAFPAARLEVRGAPDRARTGDVLELDAAAFDASNRAIDGVPVTWSYTYDPGEHDIRSAGGTAEVRDGWFVAELPGIYTIMAKSGPLTARHVVEVEQRQVVQRVDFEGHGQVSEYHTSDFWVFEGNDGRDYAITGTWGAAGWAYMWDVTDPANPVRTDSVQVDARTVNDVKVSPDARYATMTREGASNRRNGLVILDLANPAHPTIASVFDEGLTGGVHNAYPTEDYVFALSAGEKYVILDVRDINNPRYVGEYRHGDCRIHDVWVHDGIAYSAQWGCGLIAVDVGNGRWGGSPENPVFISEYATPGGRTHAVYPYYQEETGTFYVFLGDEIMNRRGLALEGGLSTERGGTPSNTAGYTHIVDWTDPANPKKVARYEVPEYGTHNIWVEDDVLYQAYYEGGMRVVDVSGKLRGNLATQGREIAVYKPYDPQGYIANAPMVWSAMPYKGRILFSDFNSGLWSVRLLPRQEPPPITP